MATLPRLTCNDIVLDTDVAAFGWLRDSSPLRDDLSALQDRMDEDGYLFLPGFFDRAEVVAVRRAICSTLASEGLLDPSTDPLEAIARPGLEMYFRPDIANSGPAKPLLEKVIYGNRLMAFFDRFLGEPATHYDYTWLRVIAPGRGTYPHCDVVYMGRGSHRLYTAWTPIGDVPLEVGGLVVVEGSHRDQGLRETYCTLDVDTICQNRSGENELNAAGYPGFGALSENLAQTRSRLGGRLLTCPEYRMGDLLLFTVFTVHGSLDNRSRSIRISSDSRYQPASEPRDERWIGENPPAHGGNMLKGMIC